MSQPLPKPSCGCSVRIITFDDPMEGTNTTINYCALHASAEELLAACDKALTTFQFRVHTRQKWTIRDQHAFEACSTAVIHAEGRR